jgi:predicted O-methyltransferase YrrM
VKSYAELKALIEKRGVHPQLGPTGENWNVEQNPHELATFLVRMQELGVQSVLEIGTGYKAGLARFLAHEMGWKVTTVDINDYGHSFDGINFLVEDHPRYTHLCRGEHDISPAEYDLVFIDGAHDYANVKADYEHWGRHATKAVAFHDIAGLRDCEGAQKFWHQLMFTEGWKSADVAVSSDLVHSAGIGWIEL